MVLVEGSPRYYGRLGAEHAVTFGIRFDLPEWAPAEAAQVFRLAAFDATVSGRVQYPPTFGVG